MEFLTRCRFQNVFRVLYEATERCALSGVTISADSPALGAGKITVQEIESARLTPRVYRYEVLRLWAGDSVLAQLTAVNSRSRYLLVTSDLVEFETDAPISNYHSFTYGGVSYPLAVTEKDMLFLHDWVSAPRQRFVDFDKEAAHYDLPMMQPIPRRLLRHVSVKP
jgi:hypothetical protein